MPTWPFFIEITKQVKEILVPVKLKGVFPESVTSRAAMPLWQRYQSQYQLRYQFQYQLRHQFQHWLRWGNYSFYLPEVVNCYPLANKILEMCLFFCRGGYISLHLTTAQGPGCCCACVCAQLHNYSHCYVLLQHNTRCKIHMLPCRKQTTTTITWTSHVFVPPSETRTSQYK